MHHKVPCPLSRAASEAAERGRRVFAQLDTSRSTQRWDEGGEAA